MRRVFFLLPLLVVCNLFGQTLEINQGDAVKIIIEEVTQFSDGALITLDDLGVIKTSLAIVNPALDTTLVITDEALSFTVGSNETLRTFDQQPGSYQIVWRTNWYVANNSIGNKDNYTDWSSKVLKIMPVDDTRVPGKHVLVLEAL